jgi:hypothetical protein
MKLFFTFLFILISTTFSQAQDANKNIGLTFSLPWINNYTYYNYELNSLTNKSGFSGFGIAIYLNQSKNKFSLNAEVLGDSPMPFGVEYVIKGPISNISATLIELNYQKYLFKKVSLILGVNKIYDHFNFKNYEDSLKDYLKTDQMYGMTLGAEYIFTSHFSLASFYRLAFPDNSYRHIISIDLRFNFDLWKKPGMNE